MKVAAGSSGADAGRGHPQHATLSGAALAPGESAGKIK